MYSHCINQSLFVVIILGLTSAYYAPYPYTWPIYYVQYPYVPCCYPVIQEIVVECEIPEEEGSETTGGSVVTIEPTVVEDPTEFTAVEETNTDISVTALSPSTILDFTTNEVSVTDEPLIDSTTEYPVTDEFTTTMVNNIITEVPATSPPTTMENVTEEKFTASTVPSDTTLQTSASTKDFATTEVAEVDQPLTNSTTEDPVTDELTSTLEFVSNGNFSESTASSEVTSASTQEPSNSNTPSFFPEVDPQ